MRLIREGIELIKSPHSFFSRERRRDGFGYPLKFGAFFVLFSAVIKSLGVGLSFINFAGIERSFQGLFFLEYLSQTSNFGLGALSAISFVDAFIGGIILIFFEAAVLHIFVKSFGGSRGYRVTLAVIAYSTALAPLIALTNVLPATDITNLVVNLYGLYIISRGFEEFHSLKLSKALLVVVLPIILVYVFGLMFTIGSRMAAF